MLTRTLSAMWIETSEIVYIEHQRVATQTRDIKSHCRPSDARTLTYSWVHCHICTGLWLEMDTRKQETPALTQMMRQSILPERQDLDLSSGTWSNRQSSVTMYLILT